jgi:tetratricopeptide (TPR) repeat protein
MKRLTLLLLLPFWFCGQSVWSALNDAMERGTVQMTQMNYEGAVQSFSEAIGANPKLAAAYFKRGQCFLFLQKYDMALPDFDATIEREPRNADALLFRGTCQANLGKSSQAIKDYSRALGINPNLAQAYVAEADLYQATGKHARAVKAYSRSLADQPSGEILIKRGHSLIKLGENDKAVEDFTQAIKLNTSNNTGQSTTTKSEAAIPQVDRGKSYSNQTTGSNAKGSRAFELRASAYMNLKQPKKAIEDLNDALEMDPQNDTFYFRRGCAWEELANFTRACEDYTHAAYINPEARYFLARAHCYHQMDKPVLAEADIRHARQLDPTVPKRVKFKDHIVISSDQ